VPCCGPFSLLLFCILALFLAPDFLMWKNIYRVNFRRLLAFDMLGSKELWAISDGLTRVELDLYHPPACFPQKRALHYRSAPSATYNSFSTDFCAGALSPTPRTHMYAPWRAPLLPANASLKRQEAPGHGGFGSQWATWTKAYLPL